jgi:hypothetical protein
VRWIFLKKLLTNVEQEVNRARDIVKGLLEFSRVREFALKPTPLGEVVQRAVRLVSSQVPPGVEVVQEVPENLVVNIDAQRLQEVFLNLLLNAIQSIEEPPGEIKIAARLDEARKQAVITVADSGCGIPRDVIDHIFDPFFTTKETGAGTGLVASATELVIAFAMGLGGTIKWAINGMVDIRLTLIILAGSLLGVQLGAIGTTYVKEYMIKVVMAVIILIVAVSRAFAIPQYLKSLGLIKMSDSMINILTLISFITMCLALAIGAIIILGSMWKAQREEKLALEESYGEIS